MQNFILASLCSRTDWFESYLVRNPEDRFSRAMALMYLVPYLNQKAQEPICFQLSAMGAYRL